MKKNKEIKITRKEFTNLMNTKAFGIMKSETEIDYGALLNIICLAFQYMAQDPIHIRCRKWDQEKRDIIFNYLYDKGYYNR